MSDGPYCPFINNKRKLNIFPLVPPPASESNLEKLKHFHGNTPSKPILLSDISQSYQSSIYENNAASYATDTLSSTMSITQKEEMSWWQMDFKTSKEIDGITFSYYEEIEKLSKSSKDEKTDTILIISSKILPNSICEKVIDCNGVISAIESSQYNMPLRELTCSLTIKEIESKSYEEYYCHVSFPIGITAKSIRFQHKNEGRIILNNLSITQFQSTQPKMKLIEIHFGEGELTQDKIQEALEKALEEMIENGEVPTDKVDSIKETIQNLVENNDIGENGATVMIEKENSEDNVDETGKEEEQQQRLQEQILEEQKKEEEIKQQQQQQQILEEQKKEEEIKQQQQQRILEQQQKEEKQNEEIKHVKTKEIQELEIKDDYQYIDKKERTNSASEEKSEKSKTEDDEDSKNDYIPSRFG